MELKVLMWVMLSICTLFILEYIIFCENKKIEKCKSYLVQKRDLKWLIGINIVVIIGFTITLLVMTGNYPDIKKVSDKIFIFIVTILYLAISFKTIGKWEIAFTQYIKASYPCITVNTVVCICIYTIFLILNILTNFEPPFENPWLFIQIYMLVSMVTFILIIMYVLYFAGNQKKMNDQIIKLFDENPNIIPKFIDEDFDGSNEGNLKKEDYYNFLGNVKEETLEFTYNKISKKESATKLEYMCIWHLAQKNFIKSRKMFKFDRNYLFELENLNYNILILLGLEKVTDNKKRKYVDAILNQIDNNFMDFADINNLYVRNVYIVNTGLVDDIIVYCIENPTINRERFLVLILQNLVVSLNMQVVQNEKKEWVFKQGYKGITIIFSEKANFYVENNMKLNELNNTSYEEFISNIKSKNNLDFLELIRKEKKIFKIGIYPAEYLEIFKIYDSYANKINIILKNIKKQKNFINIQLNPFNHPIDFNNVDYTKIADCNEKQNEIKNELINVSIEMKNEMQKYIKNIKMHENENSWRDLKDQIESTNEISISIFNSYYLYIFENVNKNNNNLSYEFWNTIKKSLEDNSYPMTEKIKIYFPNIQLMIYRMLIQNDRFTGLFSNPGILKIDEREKVLEDKKEESNKIEGTKLNGLTFAEINNMNYLVCIIQYYIDNSKLPPIYGWEKELNIIECNIENTCKRIKKKYTTNYSILQPIGTINNAQYKKLERNLILDNEKIKSSIIGRPIYLNFEKRTVFAVLLKLISGIEYELKYNEIDRYEKKIAKLLGELGIQIQDK